ncbi:MAG TPA: hypothetical protein PKN22_02820 [Taishania sp.]|nr:hypothetical protein [Taishania sp.]
MKYLILYFTFFISTLISCSQTYKIYDKKRSAFDLLQIKGEVNSVVEYTCSATDSLGKIKLKDTLQIPTPKEWVFDSTGSIKFQNLLNYKNLNNQISHKFIIYDHNKMKELWYEVRENDTLLVEKMQLNDSLKNIHSISYNYAGTVTSKSSTKYTSKKVETTITNKYSKDQTKTIGFLNENGKVDSLKVFINGKLHTEIRNEYQNNELSKIVSKNADGLEKELLFKYNYDDLGNWVEKIMYENGNLISVTIRKINYNR